MTSVVSHNPRYPVEHQVLRIDMRSRAIDVFCRVSTMDPPNDLAIANDGTIYASGPAWNEGHGQVWKVDRQGVPLQVARGLGTTKGIEVSPDGKWLYVNESVQRNVWRFSIRADGSLGEKSRIKPFSDFGFDGMRCDMSCLP